MENSKFICVSHLKSIHGVPPSLTRRHFGEPDKTIPNPRCPSGNRKIELYDKDRIKGIMESPEFQEDLAKSRTRSASHKKDAKHSWM